MEWWSLETGEAYAGANPPKGNDIYSWGSILKEQMLRGVSPRSFMEIVRLESGVFGNCNRFVSILRESPELLAKLEGLGNNSFTYQGIDSRGGDFKEGNSGIMLSVRDYIPARKPIPHILQPLSDIKEKGIGIQLTPALNTSDVTPEHIKQLQKAIANYVGPNGERYSFDCPRLRDVGLAQDGTPYVLDEDAIIVYEQGQELPQWLPAEPEISNHKPWVNEDGSWKQYTDFKELHEHYDSPLHQKGGVLAPEAPIRLEGNAAGTLAQQEGTDRPASGSGKGSTSGSVDPVVIGAGVVAAGSGIAAMASLRGGDEQDGQKRRMKVTTVLAAAVGLIALGVVGDRMFNNGKATNHVTRLFAGRGGNDAQRSV